MDPFAPSLFLFCGKRRDRIKALLWEGDGFVMLYKRLENGSFKWPKSSGQVKSLSQQEFKWLMEGLSVEQPKAIKPAKPETPGQLCLFNEAEVEANPNSEEPIKNRVDGYYRKNSRTKREELIKDLPVREVLCDILKEDLYCIQCNSTLKPIGKETVREELEYIPAKLQIVRYVRMAYECPKCKHTEI